MAWLSLVRAVLSLMTTIGEMMRARRLMDAGAAEASLKALQGAMDDIDKANAARLAAERRDADPSRLRDDDGYRRD